MPSSARRVLSSAMASASSGALRRRRNEPEYPERPGDDAGVEEATAAVEQAEVIITAAQSLIDQLGLF